MRNGLILAACLFATVPSSAATLHVWTNSPSPGAPYNAWTNAAHDIQTAVAASVDGDVILVTNGTYAISSPIGIAAGISLQSVNGAYATIVDGVGTTRCLNVTHAAAVVQGFTLRCGIGAGVGLDAGTVRGCIVRECDNYYYPFPGGNGDGLGGGIVLGGGLLDACTVMANTARSNDGRDTGGGIYCTGSATVQNCIVFGNTAQTDPNIRTNATTAILYTCTLPAVAGTGNIAANPLVFDSTNGNFLIDVSSPCVDAGTNQAWMTGAKDGAGYSRIFAGRVDIGAVEAGVQAVITPRDGVAPLAAVLTAGGLGTGGPTTYVAWDYDADGTTNAAGIGLTVLTNTYNGFGVFAIALFASNSAGEYSRFVRTNAVQTGPAALFVSEAGSHTYPYTNWAGAATNLHAAFVLGVGGTTVWITNGTYGVRTNAEVLRGMTVRSVNGGLLTVIDGGATAICLRIAHSNAVVSGLTITRGSTGVLLDDGTLRNSLVTSNRNYACPFGGNGNARGAGVHLRGGLLESCTIVGNEADGCVSPGFGGGVYCDNLGTIRNCIVYDNIAADSDASANFHLTNGAQVTVEYSCIYGTVAGAGNFTNHPQLATTGTWAYVLSSNSPCVDAGNVQAWMGGATDFALQPRLRAASVDVGAYELQISSLDTDLDGLPDWWELRHFSSATAAVPADDGDVDRMTNLQEYRAGTEPTNVNSRLAVEQLASPNQAGFVIEWSSVPGRLYEIDRTTNLVAGPFQPVVSNLPGAASSMSYTDAVTSGPGLYRVVTQP